MPSIIKKGTNPSQFYLKNGYTILLQPDIVCTMSDEIFDQLMRDYGCFIRERRITDANKDGCFIIHDNREYVETMGKEVADEIQDNSAPIKVDELKKKRKKK